jgi:hypothetical protein
VKLVNADGDVVAIVVGDAAQHRAMVEFRRRRHHSRNDNRNDDDDVDDGGGYGCSVRKECRFCKLRLTAENLAPPPLPPLTPLSTLISADINVNVDVDDDNDDNDDNGVIGVLDDVAAVAAAATARAAAAFTEEQMNDIIDGSKLEEDSCPQKHPRVGPEYQAEIRRRNVVDEPSLPLPSSLLRVCNGADCVAARDTSCRRTHACGHDCGGVRGEAAEACLPCLHIQCVAAAATAATTAAATASAAAADGVDGGGVDDNGVVSHVIAKPLRGVDADSICAICYTDSVSAAPALVSDASALATLRFVSLCFVALCAHESEQIIHELIQRDPFLSHPHLRSLSLPLSLFSCLCAATCFTQRA